MDYLLPTAREVPKFDIGHVETPSPFTTYGVKGGGEGGRMIAPAALASAVEDALAPLGVRVDEVPMTPERIASLVEAAPGAELTRSPRRHPGRAQRRVAWPSRCSRV